MAISLDFGSCLQRDFEHWEPCVRTSAVLCSRCCGFNFIFVRHVRKALLGTWIIAFVHSAIYICFGLFPSFNLTRNKTSKVPETFSLNFRSRFSSAADLGNTLYILFDSFLPLLTQFCRTTAFVHRWWIQYSFSSSPARCVYCSWCRAPSDLSQALTGG